MSFLLTGMSVCVTFLSFLYDEDVRHRDKFVRGLVSNLGVKMTYLDIEVRALPPYNLIKKYKATEEGYTMEQETRCLINELLDTVTDADLLDLIYKILLESTQGPLECVM